MIKKDRKCKRYKEKFIFNVVKFSKETSIARASEKFNVPISTIKTWRSKEKKSEFSNIWGRKNAKHSIEEKYEILKKYIDFLETQKSKK